MCKKKIEFVVEKESVDNKIEINYLVGSKKHEINKIMVKTALDSGKSEQEICDFEKKYRIEINKKNGAFSGKEFSEYFKRFERWLNAT